MRDVAFIISVVSLGTLTGWLIHKDARLIEENEILTTTLKLANNQLEHMLKTWEPKKN